MRPKGYRQSRGQRPAISQGMHAYHTRVREVMAHCLRVKKSARVKKSPRLQRSPRFTAPFGAAAMFLVVIGVVAAAMLIAARGPSRIGTPSMTLSARTTPATRLAAAITPVNPPEESAAKKASASKTPSPGAAPATRLAAAMAPGNAPEESAANAPEPTPAVVTITGCLERHDETFRLNDTAGMNAPKSRSWRSGFLKKGSAPIEVVDAANRLKFTDLVGQRVSVTGVFVDREIQVRSLRRVATSCSS